jgi:replicative DNA helicase
MESFKESGAVEYSSDVLIGLQLECVNDFEGKTKPEERKAAINAAKRANPRKVELVILKNRNGETGKTIAYNYYPMFNHFEERP